jgi:hypothetical protein
MTIAQDKPGNIANIARDASSGATSDAGATAAAPSSRRRFIGAAGAASLVLAAPGIVRAQARKAMKVSVGRQPWAAGNSPVTQYMIANKLFEKYGTKMATT